jgi:TRAP-type transport system periplasmic protein
MNRFCKSSVLFIPGLVLFSWFVAPHAYSADQAIQLKVAGFFPTTHEQSIILDQWGKELEQKTNGRVKVRCYHAGTLVPSLQIYDATVKGITDVGNHVLGFTMGRFPLSEVIDLPHGYPSGSVATKMVNEFYKKFKPKEFDDVKVLWFHAQSPGIVHTKTKPIARLEDFKGMKIRTFGSNAPFMTSLGGTPVAMPMTDTYDALSKGVVVGLMAAYEVLDGWKLADHIQYSTENFRSSYTADFVVAMNKKKWNSLPKDIQTIIDQMSEEYIDKYGVMWDKIEVTAKDYAIKRGIKIITIPKEEDDRWAERAKPLFDDYIKKTKEKGLPGDEAMAFIRNYLKPYKDKVK